IGVILLWAMLKNGVGRAYRSVASGLLAVLIIKVVVIRPLLNRRTDAVLAGIDDGGSALHLFYIAADGLLIVGLVAALVLAVRRWVTIRPQQYTRRRPRGPSMTSTGVSKTRESTSPVMICSGLPNSTTLPCFTAQMWSALRPAAGAASSAPNASCRDCAAARRGARSPCPGRAPSPHRRAGADRRRAHR